MELPIQTEALVVHKPGDDFVMTPILIQNMNPDEILVEMKYTGLCHTDFLLRQGHLPGVRYPAIAGHEGAGIILSVGSAVKDKSLNPGDKVLLSFYSCGNCPSCLEDRLPTKCPDMPRANLRAARLQDGSSSATLTDGITHVSAHFFGHSSFSRISVVHELSVVKCDDLDNKDMALYAPMGCGYQTGAGTILNILKPKPYHHSLVVFGMGSVGFAAMMAAVAVGVKQIIAVDLVEGKLASAKELGATDIIQPGLPGVSVVEEIKRITDRNFGVQFAIDTTGAPKVVEEMLECLRPGGTAVSVGAPPPDSPIKVDAGAFFHMNKNWLSVIEGDSYPPELIPRLTALHRKGKFPVEKISKTYPVAEIKQAIEDMEAGKVRPSTFPIRKLRTLLT
ncbi:chaperonin 10-like protein [Podospora australis]|uniref:Chaperonin 10-like protein n=1 Tax=Podospora australis TaxID=1536484 RepID=A0AAN7AEW0_9PEZI|nr:chaperonin 10-like protein [Podospora australis]